jgi:molybdenum cofactor cytidylyltransferase
VVVVLRCGADDTLAGLELGGAQPVVCDSRHEGRSAWLACGLAELSGCEAVVVTVGDRQRLTPEAVERVIDARGGSARAVRATYAGVPGYPVLLERELADLMRDVPGDHGARNLMRSARAREVPCDDLRAYAVEAGVVTSPSQPRSSSR